MMKKIITKFPALLLALVVGVITAQTAFASATIVIQNNDAAGFGFNDTTAATPVGGNSGTTLGQQRLIAFQTAANIWGATLTSGPTITIRATWANLTCTANSAVLGQAGATGSRSDFAGAPIPGTWYSVALANALAGTDLNGSTAEISAQFNINLGNTGCLEGSHWYLGLDGNHGNDVDLVTVLLHEFGHGLGFQTLTNASSGAQAGGLPSIYDRFLLDNSTGKTWAQMTDAERAASAINTGHLVWTGQQVVSDAHSLLGNPRLRVNSPAAIAGNYQIGTADFGPPISAAGVTANVAQALYGGSATDGCSAITNAGAVAGKIALIDRGNCTFVSKAKNAQNAGAVGVIIVNNVSGNPPGMTGADPTLVIPTASISQADGATIKAQLASGVNATLALDTTAAAGADSSGRPFLYAPNPFEGGSSVSHWDSSAFPNQLMEPNISGDLSHSVGLPQDLTASLMKDIGWAVTVVSPPSGPSTIQLSAASYSVSEGQLFATINVTRTGDLSGTSTVKYATSDATDVNFQCNPNTAGQATGFASRKCDYHIAVGRLRFAAGETTKQIVLSVVDDVYVEGPETFTLTLSNPTGATLGTNSVATVTITDNDTAGQANPIDNTRFYVRELYVDLLSREPDQAGWDGWTNRINLCGQPGQAPPPCDRVTVGGDGFLSSSEFFDRQLFVLRLYRVGLGRIPNYSEVGDLAYVSGFLSSSDLELNKQELVSDIMSRSEFSNRYNGLTNSLFVSTLLQTANVTVPTSDQTAWVNALNGSTKTRAQVYREISERAEVTAKYQHEAQVISCYYGFFTRNPDGAYLNFLQRLDSGQINLGDLANAFINAAEYRQRFGP
jgi:hypothetical protein